MRRKFKNRILSMILCGSMVAGMLPFDVCAEETIIEGAEIIPGEAAVVLSEMPEGADSISEDSWSAPEEIGLEEIWQEDAAPDEIPEGISAEPGAAGEPSEAGEPGEVGSGELGEAGSEEPGEAGAGEPGEVGNGELGEAGSAEPGEEGIGEPEEAWTEDESEYSADLGELVMEIEEIESGEVLSLGAGNALEGNCGMNGAQVNWKFADGVLTVSGSGEMDDYITVVNGMTGEIISSNVQPWLSLESQIQEVIIENGVTAIGYGAFADLSSLRKVTIASSVKKIRHDAFANCTSLTEVNMGSGVETMETDVFYGAAVVSLTLPKSLKTLDAYALVGLWSVENIYVESGNSVFQSKDGVLFKDGGKTLVYYPMNRKGEYTVPAGTVKIDENAFSQSEITKINFPDSVTEIGESAFSQCKQLTGITFPKNLKVIEKYVCMGDTSLRSVTIPEGVTAIKSWAFWDCSSLESVMIPASVKSLDEAFPKGTAVKFANTSIHQQEDGSFVDAVKVKISVKEEYKKAFEVLNLVNKEREKAGVEKLVMDTSLLETAMLRATETVLYWDHTRPSGSDCFTANSLMYGENIAYGSSTASGVMSMWMNSPGHRANILGGYGSIGIGCVYYGGTYFWVQCFGAESSSVAQASSYKDKTVSRNIVVKKDEEYYKASFNLSKTKLTVGDTAKVEVSWNGMKLADSGAVMESSNTAVCKVSNGTVTAVGAGKAQITCYFSGYQEKAVKISVTVTAPKAKTIKVTYNANGGKVKQKSKTVTQNAKFGTLASPTRKGYTFSGWYTAKKGGKKITSSSKVTAKKNMTLYARWKKVTVKKASLQNVSNTAGKKMTVKIKKTSGAAGYQIVYATNSKFTKGKKSISVTKTSKVITKLKKGKTYYVKVRAYKKDSAGAKVYGDYSKVQKVKIKK